MAKKRTDEGAIGDSSYSDEESVSNRDVTNLSVGKIVAYGVGGLTIIVGVTMLVENIFAGVIMMSAGAFGFPPVRDMVEDEFNIKMSRWLAVLIYLCLVFFAASVTQPS